MIHTREQMHATHSAKINWFSFQLRDLQVGGQHPNMKYHFPSLSAGKSISAVHGLVKLPCKAKPKMASISREEFHQTTSSDYRARKNGLQNVINTTQAGLGRLV